MRRSVITGMGLVTPLGVGVEANWQALLEGRSGAKVIDRFSTEDLRCKIGCMVPKAGTDDDPAAFEAEQWVSRPDQRKMDEFIVYAISAAEQALDDAGWRPDGEEDLLRTGVIIGSGIGGLQTIEAGAITVKERGARKLSPFFIPASLINLASGHVAIRNGFKGPNHSVVTACSTGAHAIGDASQLIARGAADVMIAGGAEAAICRLGVAGFSASRALSTGFNDDPQRASRPWDKDRDGFVMGEGSGIVVVEELEHAKARGATIYAEIRGYGMSGDAHHITAPSEDGNGGYRAMELALKAAGLNTSDIDYINAHGTSTPLGDEIELGAVKRLFGDDAYKLSMSSTKSAIGHLLGAAGSVEAIYSVMAINTGVVPPTINLDEPSPSCDLDLVPKQPKEREVRAILSNSFGFGGTNAALVLSPVD